MGDNGTNGYRECGIVSSHWLSYRNEVEGQSQINVIPGFLHLYRCEGDIVRGTACCSNASGLAIFSTLCRYVPDIFFVMIARAAMYSDGELQVTAYTVAVVCHARTNVSCSNVDFESHEDPLKQHTLAPFSWRIQPRQNDTMLIRALTSRTASVGVRFALITFGADVSPSRVGAIP